jgi:hypothetical protein
MTHPTTTVATATAAPTVADAVAATASARTARAERLALLAERRRAERCKELIDLQRERPELVQAYAPASFAADALRWAV